MLRIDWQALLNPSVHVTRKRADEFRGWNETLIEMPGFPGEWGGYHKMRAKLLKEYLERSTTLEPRFLQVKRAYLSRLHGITVVFEPCPEFSSVAFLARDNHREDEKLTSRSSEFFLMLSSSPRESSERIITSEPPLEVQAEAKVNENHKSRSRRGPNLSSQD